MGIEPSIASMESPEWGAPQYEILAELSNGPLGRVRLGRAVRGRDVGRCVRLRAITSQQVIDLSLRLERAARIAHPRLLKVLAFAMVDGEPQIASEFVEGATLSDLLQAAWDHKEWVEPSVALRLVLDLLSASIAARAAYRATGHGELERCIWPDAAWVATFGEALLTEAGLGSLLAEGSPVASAYLSPEEVAGEPGGERSDVFAAGVLLWELFANRPLFGGGELAEIAERVRSLPIPRLGETGNFGAPVPDEVAEIVARALARDPAERFAGAEEMAARIASLPKHLIAGDERVQAALGQLVEVQEARRSASTLKPASGAQEINWDVPTRSLRAPRALSNVEPPESDERLEDRVTLRPHEAESGGIAVSGLHAPKTVRPPHSSAAPCVSVHPASSSSPPGLEPEALLSAAGGRASKARTAVLVALALACAAAGYYWFRGSKPGHAELTPATGDLVAVSPRARPEPVVETNVDSARPALPAPV